MERNRVNKTNAHAHLGSPHRDVCPQRRAHELPSKTSRSAMQGTDARSRVHRHRRQSSAARLSAHAWEQAAKHVHAPTDISDSRLQSCVLQSCMYLYTTPSTEGFLQVPTDTDGHTRAPLSLAQLSSAPHAHARVPTAALVRAHTATCTPHGHT